MLQVPRFNKRELDVEKLWQLAHVQGGGYDTVGALSSRKHNTCVAALAYIVCFILAQHTSAVYEFAIRFMAVK